MRQLAIVLVIGCALLSSGCATMALFEWRRDEVAIAHGQVQVKNVPGVSDGWYAVVGPEIWPQDPVVQADDGIVSLSPPIEFSLSPRSRDTGYIDFRGMDLSEARQPFSPRGQVVMATVACVEKGEERHYRVHMLRGDSGKQRWVRSGTIDIGSGTQSAARGPVTWVLLPFTVAADIVSLPLLLVGGLGIGVLEGISALLGNG
ncbi:MAG: hypothetical protein EXS08_02020 [Planctomycetes bacterium]|nr:hypothetical protein [Planctomycetota bacterium]